MEQVRNGMFRTMLESAEPNTWYTIHLHGRGIKDSTGKWHTKVYGTPIGNINPPVRNDRIYPSQLFRIKCEEIENNYGILMSTGRLIDIPNIQTLVLSYVNTKTITSLPYTIYPPEELPRTKKPRQGDYTFQNSAATALDSQAATEVVSHTAATKPDSQTAATKPDSQTAATEVDSPLSKPPQGGKTKRKRKSKRKSKRR